METTLHQQLKHSYADDDGVIAQQFQVTRYVYRDARRAAAQVAPL